MGTHLVLCTRHSIFIVNNISVMMFTKWAYRTEKWPCSQACSICHGLSNPSGARLSTSSRPKMVDPFHADSDVCGIHPADAVHSTAGRGDYGGRNNPHQHVQHHADAVHHHGFASATHDIAADGFYMLALKQSDQAAFVGIRSTFTGSPLSSDKACS